MRLGGSQRSPSFNLSPNLHPSHPLVGPRSSLSHYQHLLHETRMCTPRDSSPEPWFISLHTVFVFLCKFAVTPYLLGCLDDPSPNHLFSPVRMNRKPPTKLTGFGLDYPTLLTALGTALTLGPTRKPEKSRDRLLTKALKIYSLHTEGQLI
jgi:hypothetical protein